MSARAWRARKNGEQSDEHRYDRARHLQCRYRGRGGARCALNRLPHRVHLLSSGRSTL